MLKRAFDVVVALTLLVLLLPVLVAVSLAVWLDVGWPVLFLQNRPGQHGQPFTLVKFRTMRAAPTLAGAQPEFDGSRLTRLGRLLRSTSVDELPELWNVLRGEMSLVGPRPLLVEYLPLYSAHHSRRHEVKPGITGWAQVHGRNQLGWQERLDLDVWYVDNRSFILDLRILLMTLVAVVRRDGIVEQGTDSRSKYTGQGS